MGPIQVFCKFEMGEGSLHAMMLAKAAVKNDPPPTPEAGETEAT